MADGFVCPECKAPRTRVIDCRDAVGSKKRVRECKACRHRFRTYEVCLGTASEKAATAMRELSAVSERIHSARDALKMLMEYLPGATPQ